LIALNSLQLTTLGKAKVEVAVLLTERWLIAALRHEKFFSLAEWFQSPAGGSPPPWHGGSHQVIALAQPQHLFDFAHGQSPLGHSVSPPGRGEIPPWLSSAAFCSNSEKLDPETLIPESVVKNLREFMNRLI